MIHLPCPRCHKPLRVKDELAGKKVKCPACGTTLAVPAVAASPAPAPLPHSARPLPARGDARPDEGSQAVPTRPQVASPPALPVESHVTLPPPGVANATTPDHPDQSGDDAALTDFLAPPQADDELGRLGGFRILKVLGHGGMGVVFLGEDPMLGRQGGHQGHAAPPDCQLVLPPALSARGPGCGGPGARQRRTYFASRRGPQRPLHRHAALERRAARPANPAGADAAPGGGAAYRPRGGPGPGRRPRGRADPPRYQTGERLAGGSRGAGEDPGLRAGAGRRRGGGPHRYGGHPGHAGLHRSRAGGGQGGRRPLRPLEPGRHALPDEHRPASLPGGEHRLDAGGRDHAQSARARAGQPRGASGVVAPDHAVADEGSRGPAGLGPGGGGHARCAGSHTRRPADHGLPSAPLRGRGVGGEGTEAFHSRTPQPRPLSPEYRGEGTRS